MSLQELLTCIPDGKMIIAMHYGYGDEGQDFNVYLTDRRDFNHDDVDEGVNYSESIAGGDLFDLVNDYFDALDQAGKIEVPVNDMGGYCRLEINPDKTPPTSVYVYYTEETWPLDSAYDVA